MKYALLCLLACAIPAWAAPTCAECGVVTSVRTTERKEPTPPTDTAKPSGLVATVPLHGGKPRVGSSTRLGKDVAPTLHTSEVIVRLDDGRLQVFTLDDAGGLAQGDKVRIEKGKLVKRTD